MVVSIDKDYDINLNNNDTQLSKEGKEMVDVNDSNE